MHFEWPLPSGIPSIQLPSLSFSNSFKVNSERVRAHSFGANAVYLMI